MWLKEKLNVKMNQNQVKSEKLIAIGRLSYRDIMFNLYFNKESKKTIAKIIGNHKEKQKLENYVTKLLEVENGNGYISIKKLMLFSGLAMCLGRPTMLVHASERVENVMTYNENENLEFNNEFIGQECILYGKEEVDQLFKNTSISKECVLKILNEHKDLTPEIKGYVKEFIETVYDQEPNADMRIFAMNLQRKPLIYTNFDARNSGCFPRENRIWLNNLTKEDIFHELSHFRTLTYGESYVNGNKKARIKVIGNSYIESHRGSGMREAYCVALNHRIGMLDRNYEALYEMECVLRSIYPDEMYEIETYNDYNGLKKIFIENGLTSSDYDLFIGTTDTIAKIYQDGSLDLDSSLVYSMMRPISTLVMNKCVKENLNYQEYILKIEKDVPSLKWKDTIIFSLLNAESYGIHPTIDQNGNKIEVSHQEVGPAFDPSLQNRKEKEEVGPGIEEKSDALLFGEENQNYEFIMEDNLYLEQENTESIDLEDINNGNSNLTSTVQSINIIEEEEVEPGVTTNDSYDLLFGDENKNNEFLIESVEPFGPAFDKSLQNMDLENETSVETNTPIGPAYDENLLNKQTDSEVVQEITDISNNCFMGEENQNYTSMDEVYDYNSFSKVYEIGSMKR